MADDHVWAVLESIGTAAACVGAGIGSVMKWFRNKERRIHERLNKMQDIKDSHDRRITALEIRHQANMDRLQRMDSTIAAIDVKQDRQTELLVKIIQAQGRHP